MANLPAVVNGNPYPELPEAAVDALVSQVAHGVHPRVLARKMYPTDRRARRNTYRRLVHAILNDQRVAQRLAASHQVELMLAVGPALTALGRRAARGNVPAIKLALEASGVHNTRIKHEHSGEIKIKFDVPRPTFEGTVTDADVVED